jgi:hypothetical protein
VPLPVPWTQSIHLAWRPELSFYDRRVEILKAFETQGFLRAFRFEEKFVDAQLFESRDLLKVRQDGLDLHLVTPEADSDRALEAIRSTLEEVNPKQPRDLSASFQYIVPLEEDFDAAVEAAFGRILVESRIGGIGFDDWAVLVNFSVEDRSTDGILEFGIIKDTEAPDRLSRRAGSVGEVDARRQVVGRWTQQTFPEVAVFVDATVVSPLEEIDDAEKLLEHIQTFWDASRSELGAFSDTLHGILSSKDLRKVESK